jgi:ketosteroid isomerase-like protein
LSIRPEEKVVFKIKKRVAMIALGLGGAMLLPAGASAEDGSSARAKAEVTQAVRAAEKLLAQGVSPETFANALYADDVVMSGGAPGAKHGKQAVIKEVKDWFDYMGPEGIKTCRYTVEDPVLASSTTVSSFLNLSCKGNLPSVAQDQSKAELYKANGANVAQDLDYTEVYVWKKYPQGWRVALEMWVPGKF